MTADAELLAARLPARGAARGAVRPARRRCTGLRGAQARARPARRASLDVWLYQPPPAALADPALWSLEPAPGGTHVAVDRCRGRAEPDAAPRARRSPGSPTRRATGCSSSRPPPCRSTRCARGCPSGCAPSAPTSAAASASRSRPPLPAPSPVRDYLRARLARAATGARRVPAPPRPRRRHLDRRPDDHPDRALRPRRRPARLPARPGRDRGVSGDGAPAHVGAAACAPRRLRAERRRCRGDVRPRRRRAEGAVRHREAGQRRGRRAGSDLAFTLEAGLTADARARRDPDLRLGRGGVLPAGRRDRVRARPPAAPPTRSATRGSAPATCSSSRSSTRTTRRATPDWARRLQPWPTDADGDARFRDAACRAGSRRWCG